MASIRALRGPGRAVAAGTILALVLGAWLAPARAGEDAEKALREQITEHARRLADCKREQDLHGLHDEMWRATALYRRVEDVEACKSLQLRLVHGVGALCRHKDERIRRCAVEVLGVLRDEEGARYLKPFLGDAREMPVDELTLAAIESAGGVVSEELVSPLLKFVEDCPCPNAAKHAVVALGSYGGIESRRERILQVLLETTLEEENLARWKALADSVPDSLSRLTGREVETLDEWLELVDDNRQDLSALFVEKEEAGT